MLLHCEGDGDHDDGGDDNDPNKVVSGTQWSTEQIITVRAPPPTHQDVILGTEHTEHSTSGCDIGHCEHRTVNIEHRTQSTA